MCDADRHRGVDREDESERAYSMRETDTKTCRKTNTSNILIFILFNRRVKNVIFTRWKQRRQPITLEYKLQMNEHARSNWSTSRFLFRFVHGTGVQKER